jgi:hypothetical protein
VKNLVCLGEKKKTRRNHKENGSQKMGTQKQENRRSWKAEREKGRERNAN